MDGLGVRRVQDDGRVFGNDASDGGAHLFGRGLGVGEDEVREALERFFHVGERHGLELADEDLGMARARRVFVGQGELLEEFFARP